MSELLNDALNLEILENICSGMGVEVNISALSKSFKKHRNTIKAHVKELFEHKIIDRPIYPFIWLYQEFPLLVVARADLPRNEKIDKFLIEDEHIFAVFYVRDEEYNTLLIEYHKDLHTYGEWRKKIVAEDKIPPRETRYPASALFFSTKNIIKYQPNSPVHIMEERFKKGEEIKINGCKMNGLHVQILKKLMFGDGIRTNENVLAQKLKVHRRTIERRISELLKENIVLNPVCRFPKFFVPPEQILVYYLVEIKKAKDKILNAIKSDAHVPLAMESNMGRYNLLLFGVFFNVEDHFRWEEGYEKRFPECFGAMKKIYLSPTMTASIDQQYVSLCIIKNRKESLRGKALIESVKDAQETMLHA
jgi:DNA-binding Lrp family transcriptional regulator